ncbi:unnamed protein product [Rhizophagus irregularis]|nr:unnamed protein product [Rhizophagus irregularis]
MIPDIYLYTPKYRRLSEEILERIEFYVTKGNMGSKQIYPLLVASFPDQYIHKRDLYNAIQKFKSLLTNQHGDAQNTINKLFELKDHEPSRLVAQCLSEDKTTESYEWFLDCIFKVTNNNPPVCLFSNANPTLINAVSSKFPKTHHYLCIFHIQENLRKNLAGKLEYLNRTLNNCYQAWARCYQIKSFTAVQQQQILGSLLYRAKTISKDSIKAIKNDNQYDYNEGFFKDQFDMPQTKLFSLLEGIQLSDIIEICLQDKTVEIVTQFQQDNNNEVLIADLHIFNQFRMPDTFTIDIKQCLQRKVKYAYRFGKMKKALNLALDLGCEDEIFNIINGFINCKKNTIKETNNENKEENLQILDPIVQK